jgi:hypothetical protein
MFANMKKVFLFAAGCLLMISCNNKASDQAASKDSSATMATEAKTPPAAEFADQKYTDMGKKGEAQMESGDIDGWVSQYSDSVRYYWSGGDSLIGKAALAKYWKDRRSNVIDSIKFSNEIWLPIKVNAPQSPAQRPGTWLLAWAQVNVKYKTGKKLMLWHHIAYHFDNNDKVDQAIQFIDRAPIIAATKK